MVIVRYIGEIFWGQSQWSNRAVRFNSLARIIHYCDQGRDLTQLGGKVTQTAILYLKRLYNFIR